MKSINRFSKQPQQIVSAVVLTSILSLSSGLTLLQTATATSKNHSRHNRELITADKVSKQDANLPSAVEVAVRQDLARKVRIPVEKLKITKSSRETWSNGCLGLPKPDEFCSQALVEGWRVTLSDGRSNWVYRTDLKGEVLRLETQTAFDLPAKVVDAVLNEAARQSVPGSQLRIIAAERRDWSDSCLGLGGPEVLCAAVIVPGWLVTVQAGEQRLIYRTSNSGSPVVFDRAASSVDDRDRVKPVRIPANELPPPLQRGVVFRAITTGGFAGFNYATNLYQDGRLTRVDFGSNGATKETQLSRVSPKQVQQFLQLLQKQKFTRLNNLEYPPNPGAADFFTTTFTSRDGTTRYSDSNPERLPRSLQKVIQAWGQILSSTRK